jgi:uncharacterized protein
LHLIVFAIVFVLLAFLVEFYFSRKILKALEPIFSQRAWKKVKRVLKAILIFLNIFPAFLLCVWLYSGITGADVFYPQNKFFNWLVIYPFWTFALFAVQCELFFLILDLIKLILYPLYRKYKSRLISAEQNILLLVFIFFAAYVPIRIMYDYNTIEIRKVVYEQKYLPEPLNNFKIAFVSDIHADMYTNYSRLNKFVKDINNQNPELVLVGGDMISYSSDYIDTAAKFMGMIKSKYGVYSCVGDHDFWAYHDNYEKSLNAVIAALDSQKVKMINDGDQIIDIGSAKMKLTFVTNTYVAKVPIKTLNNITNDTTKYGIKILVTHQPSVKTIDEAAEEDYNLILAGHTHGGQITFLFPFINLTPTMIETKYIRGNFTVGNSLLIVTRGLGMSLVPMRYNSTPEVTVITLKKSY